MKRIVLESNRLLLREMTLSNMGALSSILQDERVMYAYNGAFNEEETMAWMQKQLQRYKDYGFGLWGVFLKDTDEMIGQCGITMQEYKTAQVPEIGYLLAHKYWHKGYAVEAATACREYGFNTLKFDELYSVIRDTNVASQKVALRNGMNPIDSIVKHYRGVDMLHLVYSVKKRQVFEYPYIYIMIGNSHLNHFIESKIKSEYLSIPSKTILLEEGKVAEKLYLIRNGCLRLFFYNERKDITFQFFFEGDIVSSFDSLYKRTPSLFCLESIEPAELIVIRRADFFNLVNNNLSFRQLYEAKLIDRFHVYQQLFLSRIKNTPQQRYEELLKEFPNIIQRVPQHYIASYLGITPVSLSRIRNRR